VTFFAVALALALQVPGVQAAARVQWLQPVLPPEEVRAQVERVSGPATHLAATEIAWPVDVDAHRTAEAAQAGLRAATAEWRRRWEAFDIERDMTWRLGEAVDALSLVESPDDAEALWAALLLQGAAATWAWSPGQRARLAEVRPLLVDLGQERALAPWVDAVALFPERAPRRADLPDQTTFQAFSQVRDLARAQRPAELTAAGLPPDAALVVDGRRIAAGDLPLALAPGRHWIHLEQGGLVLGARRVRLAPGQRLDIEGRVPAADLARALDRTLAGDLGEVPGSVRGRIAELRAEVPDEPYYLAAWSGRGAPEVYAYDGEHSWEQGEYDRAVLLVAGIGFGGGLAGSSAFEEAPKGEDLVVPVTALGLSAELCWRRWGGQLELAVHDTAGEATITYGRLTDRVNAGTSSFARVTVAPVFQVLRYRPRRVHLSVGVPLGVLTPAHQGLGVQTWLGVPVGRTTWLRAGAGFWSGTLREGWVPDEGAEGRFGLLTVQVGVGQKVF